MIEEFIRGDLGRASVGDEAAQQMTRKQIEAALAEIRRRGFARAVERPIPGVNAFSAPVFDHSGSIALAITAIGPSGIFDPEWDSPIAKQLLEGAHVISNRLGFSSNSGNKPA
jgi:DNA-binding IclR family transcriptional regulator